MPLTSASLTCQATWALSKINSGYRPTIQGPESNSFTLSGLLVSTFNQLLAQTYVIASGATTTIDLTSLTNLVGESFGFGHVLSLQIIASGDQVTLAPGASNGNTLFFGGTSPTATIPAGGMLAFSYAATGTGKVVDSTHKTVDLTASGAGTTTVDVVILGSVT